MAEEDLFEMLNLSIDFSDGVVVDYITLRVLLLGILTRLSPERESADRREADGGRDAHESQPDEKNTREAEDSEEGVTKCITLVQGLLKENQQLKEETQNLKKEVEKLQKQLSQCVTLEDLQAALIAERQMKQLKERSTDLIPDLTLSQASSGVEHHPETPEALADMRRLQEKHESLQ